MWEPSGSGRQVTFVKWPRHQRHFGRKKRKKKSKKEIGAHCRRNRRPLRDVNVIRLSAPSAADRWPLPAGGCFVFLNDPPLSVRRLTRCIHAVDATEKPQNDGILGRFNDIAQWMGNSLVLTFHSNGNHQVNQDAWRTVQVSASPDEWMKTPPSVNVVRFRSQRSVIGWKENNLKTHK